MKPLFPTSFGLAFLLLLVQTYLLVHLTLLLLRRLKLLKRPYGGMDHSESLQTAIILLGVLFISSGDAAGIFQSARTYMDGVLDSQRAFFLFFARSFLITLFFSVLFVILNYLNVRFLFRGHFQGPMLPVSILLCAISIGVAIICWLSCKEVIDNITPKLINFQ